MTNGTRDSTNLLVISDKWYDYFMSNQARTVKGKLRLENIRYLADHLQAQAYNQIYSSLVNDLWDVKGWLDNDAFERWYLKTALSYQGFRQVQKYYSGTTRKRCEQICTPLEQQTAADRLVILRWYVYRVHNNYPR